MGPRDSLVNVLPIILERIDSFIRGREGSERESGGTRTWLEGRSLPGGGQGRGAVQESSGAELLLQGRQVHRRESAPRLLC